MCEAWYKLSNYLVEPYLYAPFARFWRKNMNVSVATGFLYNFYFFTNVGPAPGIGVRLR